MILTQTPLRVSLFGGGSDYPEFFMEHEGAVLGMAINKFVYVGVQAMHPGQVSRYRVQYSAVDDCQTVAEIKHPAVRAALQYYGIDTQLEFHCFGDAPGRAGLGSSSAFCVGALKALQAHFNLPSTSSPLDLASEAISFERYSIPETVGYQDQIFAAVGGLNFITFDKTGSKIHRLPLPAEQLEELEQAMVLVYTGSMRDAHKMADKQVSEIPKKNATVNKMVELAYQGRDLLLNSTEKGRLGWLLRLGFLLHKAWMSKIELCPEVTTPEINDLYEHGIDCGAVGGKLLGAGGGGFFLFLVPPNVREQFERNIGTPCLPVRISNHGARAIDLEAQV